MSKIILIMVSFAVASPERVYAQGTPATTDARAAAQRMFTATTPIARMEAFTNVVSILQQITPTSPENRQALGRSIASIAVNAHATDGLLGTGAVAALASAGSPDAKVPYEGAFAELKYVFENATDEGIRAAALQAASKTYDRRRVFAFLTDIAQSSASPSFAYEAVRILAEHFAGEGARTILRLTASGLIKDDMALRWISMNEEDLQRRARIEVRK